MASIYSYSQYLHLLLGTLEFFTGTFHVTVNLIFISPCEQVYYVYFFLFEIMKLRWLSVMTNINSKFGNQT